MSQLNDVHDHYLRHVGDVFSIGTAIGTLVGWLPSLAALFTVIWTLIRIYETKTFQGWLQRLKEF